MVQLLSRPEEEVEDCQASPVVEDSAELFEQADRSVMDDIAAFLQSHSLHSEPLTSTRLPLTSTLLPLTSILLPLGPLPHGRHRRLSSVAQLAQ
eukprot:436405-Prorocentrum_minimum.AAC.1